MKRMLFFLTMLLFMGSLAWGQTTTITGQVKNERGEPVPFVNVTESGTRNSVQADAQGNFTIRVQPGAQLVFSATGYAARTVTAANGEIILNTQAGDLQEVVITTGLGIQRQAIIVTRVSVGRKRAGEHLVREILEVRHHRIQLRQHALVGEFG